MKVDIDRSILDAQIAAKKLEAKTEETAETNSSTTEVTLKGSNTTTTTTTTHSSDATEENI